MSKPKTQSTLFDEPRPGSNLPEFSVAEISRLLKKNIEDTFGLVRIRGEISDCKLHSSGHLYLTLKEDTVVLAAVCWRGQMAKLALRFAWRDLRGGLRGFGVFIVCIALGHDGRVSAKPVGVADGAIRTEMAGGERAGSPAAF